MKTFVSASLGLAMLLASAAAYAAEKADVKANGGVQVIYSFVSSYPNSCNSADPPRFKIKQQAANGRVYADVVKTTWPATHKKCAGKPVQVFVVAYEPKRGYRGNDSASVTMSYTLYSNESIRKNRNLRFDINVK
ncbi:MAG TPA: hypothetical protein VK862_14435 [Afifellaceae bacterium]|nr:hypothetical protein [Afifellaceae bacterium]